jgi:hypothetical protein
MYALDGIRTVLQSVAITTVDAGTVGWLTLEAAAQWPPGAGSDWTASPDAQKQANAMATQERHSLRSTPTNRLTCRLMGHLWLANGVRTLRTEERRLPKSPDWQTCFRCGKWQLLP